MSLLFIFITTMALLQPERKLPVEFIGDEILINPDLLEANVPYPFPFGGTIVVAVKDGDGGIDFYSTIDQSYQLNI